MCKINANPAVNDDYSAYVALAEGKTVEDSEKVEVSSAKTLQPTISNGIKLLGILLLSHYYLF